MTINLFETEVGMGRYEPDSGPRPNELLECVVVVSGPDNDGDITLMGAGTTFLPPETAKAPAVEIMKRLGVKLMERTRWALNMSCVSGDEVIVAIHRQEDVARWLKTLDHEGSSWSVIDTNTQRRYAQEEWPPQEEHRNGNQS